jgi:hypothetical protein
MNLRVPLNPGDFLNNPTTGGFSRRAQLHDVSRFTSNLCTVNNRTHNSTLKIKLSPTYFQQYGRPTIIYGITSVLKYNKTIQK